MQPNQYATIAGNTTLVCQPEAAPYPTTDNDGFVWYKNNIRIVPSTEPGSRIQLLSNGNLFITSIQQNDQGQYKCEARNTYGTATTFGNLTVLRKLDTEIFVQE